jgi:DNA-directed RNA polymerase specialized sigma24 family protein
MLDLDAHLAAIQAGDPDAFARWVAGAEPIVRRGLRPFAAAVDTEAVLQETLLRVWQVAPRLEPDGRPNGLLRLAGRIARNLAISERRHQRADATDPTEIDLGSAPAVSPLDPFLRQALEECRGELPEKPARALEARLGAGGLEPDEVLAARLAMRPNTFLQNFTRARRLLAACLERHGIDLDAELAP